MKRQWGSAVLAAATAAVLMGFRPQAVQAPAPPPDLSTPQTAVRSFLSALAKNDGKAMALCVKGAGDAAAIESGFTEDFPNAGLVVNDVVAWTNGSSAKVAVEATLTWRLSEQRAPGVAVSAADLFTLERQGDRWQIVPDPRFLSMIAQLATAKGSPGEYQMMSRPLAMMAAIVALPRPVIAAMERARQAAIGATCLSNVKQLDLAVLMYTQDYDEVYPRKATSYRDLIFPYVKSATLFTCPLDPKGTISYTLNPHIQNRTLASIVAPDRTVAIYEGKDGKLNYRHDGKAVVGFADGHCKLIGPEDAKELYWYPAGKIDAPAKKLQVKRHGAART